MESLEYSLRNKGVYHEEQTGVVWSDEYWLKCTPLDNSTVMHYFYMSVFYDKSANNEKTREDLSRLKYMKGLEYMLVHSIPEVGIFHIRKQYRQGEKKIIPISMYYVLSGKIYEAPSLGKVLQAKLRNLSFCLNQSLYNLAACAEQGQ